MGAQTGPPERRSSSMIGLPPFLEPGASVLRGRDADREGLLRMLSKQWVRAGLLVGEVGVGKTAFLRRGVVPHLREEGGVVLLCEDPTAPTRSFAEAAAVAGYTARPGESPLDLLARAVDTASGNALWTLVLDDLDLVLGATPGGAQELADLLSRVCPRPGGRARFLVSAASARVAACDALERLTGPLFAATCRYTLPRLEVGHGSEMLADALAAEGLDCDPAVARAVMAWLAAHGGILPADVRILVRAMRKLGVRTEGDLMKAGGPGDLARRWIVACGDSSGDRPSALRVLGELAAMAATGPLPVEDVARRAGVGFGFAGLVAQCGVEWGLCARVAGGSHTYALAHESLAEHVRMVTAPEMERADRARRGLEEAAARHGRVSWRGWWAVKRAHVSPSSPEQQEALRAATRIGRRVLLSAAAIPILLALLCYVALWGRFHLVVEGRSGGDRLVVRAGRPALRSLFWLPHRPAFGSVVADPGLAKWMVGHKAWAEAGRTGGSLGDAVGGRPEYVARCLALLRPPLRGAIRYVLDEGGEGSLAGLEHTLKFPEEWIEALALLEPVARGGDAEGRLLATALADRRHEVRAAALVTVARVERRRPGLYRDVLAMALASPDAAVARRAGTVVHGLPDAERIAIAARGAVRAREPKLRDRLLSDIGRPSRLAPGLAAEVGGALLAGGDALSRPAADTAWGLLEHAFSADGAAATQAVGAIIASGRASEPVRLRALELLDGREPAGSLAAIGPAIAGAVASKSASLRAAALPLHARLSPALARPLLQVDGRPELRCAQALAWGEIAATDATAARAAIEPLLADTSGRVRADAARAYGRLGRAAQEKLIAMVKDLGVVGEGAAWGLAASVEAGASLDDALLGIGRLWAKKGAPKRAAARVYAHMARTRPAAVLAYLGAAARDVKDAELRRIGVDGLCAVHAEGKERGVAGALAGVAAGPSAESRAQVAGCIAAHQAPAETVLRVTDRLKADAAGETRRLAASALASVAAKGVSGRTGRELVDQLADLATDRSRDVRAESLAALAALSRQALAGSRSVARALREAWKQAADEDEKLLVLAAFQSAGDATLLELAAADGSPRVRVRAIEATAAATGDLRLAVERGLDDIDPRVRRAAVRALAEAGDRVARADAVELLETALGDADVAAEALALYARLEYPTRAIARVETALYAPSERDRAMGARAAAVLVLRDVTGSRRLLEGALSDPARDVRSAAIEALAEVEAQLRSPADLARALSGAEQDAARRLVTARALLLAAAAGRRGEVEQALAPVAKAGPPMARLTAEIALALLRHDADGPAFLAALVP